MRHPEMLISISHISSGSHLKELLGTGLLIFFYTGRNLNPANVSMQLAGKAR